MRPDSRLLVPVSALPFVPGDVREVWDGEAYTPNNRTAHHFLDASASPKRDGIGTRWDLLGWLLTVIDPIAHRAVVHRRAMEADDVDHK